MAGNDGNEQPLLYHQHDGEEKPPLHGARRFRRGRSAPSAEPEEPPPPVPDLPPGDGQSAVAPPVKSLFNSARPSFRLVGLLLLAYLLAGSTAFYLAMDLMSGRRTIRALDALYFCVVTMTTVGYGDLVPASDASKLLDALYFCVVTMTTVDYGDLVPASDASKLLASAFAFAGVPLVGTFLSKSADYLEKQEALLFRAVHDGSGGTGKPRHPARAQLHAMEANRTRHKLYTCGALLAVCVASGTAFLWKVERMRAVDAFYCVCATVTTLGYGDRSFTSAAGRAFAAVWVTVSAVVVGLFFLHVVDLYARQRWTWTATTGAAEFVLYKLKELGKMSQEDVSEFLEEFERLDADNSYTLSPSDLAVSQPAAAPCLTY